MPVGNLRALTSPVGYARLAAALFTCVTFSLVVHGGGWGFRGGVWCLFAWCFCFAFTTLVLLVEFTGVQSQVPVSWRNAPITLAMLGVLMCLSASVIYPLYHLGQGARGTKEEQSYRIAATVFSCLATLAYGAEVSLSRARPGEVTGYMATLPGLLKVMETFTACVIFVFVSQTDYSRHGGLQWCLAVYCICFVLSVGVVLLCVGECTGWLPVPFDRFLGGYALLAVLLYATATIVWPIYSFDRRYGGSHGRWCRGHGGACEKDNQLAVAILTALNLLVYLADLVYSSRLIFVRSS
ncbi:myeloid-associated differentiation marker homolog [Heptranchias perlo]|uniref:myeloid-associated differentiation marker homolog n=1 Tax=Heptranchias perlo TaxID=212740 RepID=UPI003559F7CC